MLFEVLLKLLVVIIKFIIWIIILLAAIPFGIYMLMLKWFPAFVLEESFGFWSVFGVLTIIGFVILWRPIMWVVGTFQVLGAGAE